MRSPVGNSFGAYLSNAMEQELLVSGAISPSAQVEVSGTLLKNDVDSSGFSRGEATISARFIVRRGDQVVYDSVKTASGQWKSSFMGAVAIGNAIEAYPHIVGRLLAQLYADPVFVKSIQ
ncbi:hypothetical protein [Burkholderia sp. Ac-20379]|uniref:hypothetical protein n=1 Tax=Burkholderia sp. Ac-20379 TaxID=2703900 RepID=UPI0019817A00|nr:hypothetical protein [Burkholderia sp. Ac-20379]MBN3728219.1 hypothetical protein [Burkholderia sp. Ac-20379]